MLSFLSALEECSQLLWIHFWKLSPNLSQSPLVPIGIWMRDMHSIEGESYKSEATSCGSHPHHTSGSSEFLFSRSEVPQLKKLSSKFCTSEHLWIWWEPLLVQLWCSHSDLPWNSRFQIIIIPWFWSSVSYPPLFNLRQSGNFSFSGTQNFQ